MKPCYSARFTAPGDETLAFFVLFWDAQISKIFSNAINDSIVWVKYYFPFLEGKNRQFALFWSPAHMPHTFYWDVTDREEFGRLRMELYQPHFRGCATRGNLSAEANWEYCLCNPSAVLLWWGEEGRAKAPIFGRFAFQFAANWKYSRRYCCIGLHCSASGKIIIIITWMIVSQ